ncbi:hypothetical protein G6F60_014348 [Rhizopus arrhizus]|nr:hypothetical protein G6F60_014348 [Rhizopus arrhizus]
MRQPQLSSCAGASSATVAAEIATASSAPTSLAAEAREVTMPRRGSGALSCRYASSLVYSAPTENAITQRSTSSSTPAVVPAVAAVGSSAVASIAAAISAIEASSIQRRPSRSPRWPKHRAPSGRIR